jgi:hypothetical protein
VPLQRLSSLYVGVNLIATVTNTSDRTIYLLQVCSQLEIALRGRWWPALGTGNCAYEDVPIPDVALPPGASRSFHITGRDRIEVQNSGTYRIHIRGFFDERGLEPFPHSAGYSGTFKVVD